LQIFVKRFITFCPAQFYKYFTTVTYSCSIPVVQAAEENALFLEKEPYFNETVNGTARLFLDSR
jgi:hypothetical protein